MRTARRVNPLLPWAAGAALSILVLGLTVVDEDWFDALSDGSPATAEPPLVVVPLESAAPPAADLATVAPEAETAPAATPDAAPATLGKSPPRIVPISPDGRGTARVGARPEAGGATSGAPAPERPVAPQPDAASPRVVPIALERPRASLSPDSVGVHLVGGVTRDQADPIQRASAERAGAAAEAAGIRLFIHYRAAQEVESATATRLAEYLRRRGFEVAGIRPVDLPVERPGVRYFFARDHAESERLLEELDWFFRGIAREAPEHASDFTHYTPRPNPGTVEIWLPATS